MAEEGKLLAIRGPSRQVSLHGRESQFELLGSVHLASPHGAIGAVIVGDPLSIAREVKPHRRDPRQVRLEMSRFRIVAHQFRAGLPALDEQLPAIPARDGMADIHWPGWQLHGLATA